MHHEFQTEDFVGSFAGVWRRVMTEPRSFFQEMPVSGGLLNPLLFLVVCAAISAIGFLIFGPRSFALMFVLFVVIRSFVGAAVLLLIARQLFGGAGDFEATYRVAAYASAPAALLWIPLIRFIVWPLVGLYSLFLLIIGLERVQAFDTVKAVLTVLISVVVLGVLGWVLGAPWGWYHPLLHR
jgi:hypothetical protein